MTVRQIKAKRKKLEAKVKKIEDRLKLAQAELKIFRESCPHKNSETYSDGGGYGGSSWADYWIKCEDCGLHKMI